MKTLKYALATLVLIFGFTSMASPLVLMTDEDDGGVDGSTGYDEWDCHETRMLKNTSLQCVSCGMQKYFADNGRTDVVPAERWLLLLGITAKQTAIINPDSNRRSDNTIVTSDEALSFYRKRVIAQIQSYGFCTQYGRTVKGETKPGKWINYVYPMTTRNIQFNNTGLSEMAQAYGFSDKGIGNHADENLRYLLNNRATNDSTSADFGEQSLQERQQTFADRLKTTLQTGYNVSGEKVFGSNTKISTDKDGDDLRVCLEQINQEQSGQGDPTMSSFLKDPSFCRAMANACELDTGFCGSDGQRPTPRPVPKSNNGGGLPSPPRPGGRGNGAIQ